MTDSDDRLLTRIKTLAPVTAADLAAALGVTAQAVREKLARLVDDGLVTFEDRVEGVGRPRRFWRLTAAGHAHFPDGHARLAVDLIGGIRAMLGDAGIDQLIAGREAAQRRSYAAALAAAGDDGPARLQALAVMRSTEGYMAEVTADPDTPGGFVLTEHHCPICAAATICQGFCRSELALFREALGPDATVERIAHQPSGDARCAYRVWFRTGRSSGR